MTISCKRNGVKVFLPPLGVSYIADAYTDSQDPDFGCTFFRLTKGSEAYELPEDCKHYSNYRYVIDGYNYKIFEDCVYSVLIVNNKALSMLSYGE